MRIPNAKGFMALDHAAGTLAARVEEWRSRLIRATGLLEATIDFAEEDIPDDLLASSGGGRLSY